GATQREGSGKAPACSLQYQDAGGLLPVQKLDWFSWYHSPFALGRYDESGNASKAARISECGNYSTLYTRKARASCKASRFTFRTSVDISLAHLFYLTYNQPSR